MVKALGIGGFFFRALDPKALGAWYRDHFDIDIVPNDYDTPSWKQAAGDTVFAPFAQDTEYFGRPEQQWMINFRVADIDAAAAELDRAVNELGLLAGYIGTDYGFTLDDARLDDFYRHVVSLDVPLFVHGATNDGVGPAGDSRLHRFGLDLIVGYTYEETLAAASFVLGGVFDRHPELDVCISHGGGAIVFLAQRFDSMAHYRGQESDFAAALGKLWFDAHLEPGPARDMVTATVGIERMVYGTNFGGWDTPASTDAFDASLTSSADRLLRLDR